MLYQQTRQAYQNVVGEGATHAGLTQHVYHHLAQDLLRAAKGVRDGDIEARCLASNHALLLLGHLESWLDFLQGEPVLEESLRTFYGMLRVSILQAQGSLDADAFERAAQYVLETAAAWQVQGSKAAAQLPQPERKREGVRVCA